MQVILLERIENLGQMGDEVAVRPGYARNYLLPQRKALRANDESRKYFERERAQLEAANLARKEEAAKVASTMNGTVVVVIRSAGDTGQLYGSVNSRDIADAITAKGFTIERSQVVIDRPIKQLGLHEFRVRLHPEVSVSITVNVAQSAEEAAMQQRLGRAITGMEEDEDEDEVEEARLEAESLFERDEEDGMPAAPDAAGSDVADGEERA